MRELPMADESSFPNVAAALETDYALCRQRRGGKAESGPGSIASSARAHAGLLGAEAGSQPPYEENLLGGILTNPEKLRDALPPDVRENLARGPSLDLTLAAEFIRGYLSEACPGQFLRPLERAYIDTNVDMYRDPAFPPGMRTVAAALREAPNLDTGLSVAEGLLGEGRYRLPSRTGLFQLELERGFYSGTDTNNLVWLVPAPRELKAIRTSLVAGSGGFHRGRSALNPSKDVTLALATGTPGEKAPLVATELAREWEVMKAYSGTPGRHRHILVTDWRDLVVQTTRDDLPVFHHIAHFTDHLDPSREPYRTEGNVTKLAATPGYSFPIEGLDLPRLIAVAGQVAGPDDSVDGSRAPLQRFTGHVAGQGHARRRRVRRGRGSH
ncbi:MAG: hypothetical protein ACRDQZ_12140 [Mycobacteriales bacterium]